MAKNKKRKISNRARNRARNKLINSIPWLNIHAGLKNSDETTLQIYGDIGDSYWDEAISEKNISNILNGIDSKKIKVFLNSLGGSVYTGITIAQLIARHPAEVHIVIDGIAASIASVIAMAGNKISMHGTSQMMVHKPWTFEAGNADDFRATAADLDKVQESITQAYKRTGLSDKKLNDLLAGEGTLMTASECLDLGFCDEIIEGLGVHNGFRASAFRGLYNAKKLGKGMSKKKKGVKSPVKAKAKKSSAKTKNAAKEKGIKKFRAEVARRKEVQDICNQYGLEGDYAQALMADPSMTGDILQAEAMAISPHAGPIVPPDNIGSGWTVGDSDSTKFNNAMSHGLMLNAGISPKKNNGKPEKLAPGYEDFVNLTGVELCRASLGRLGVNMSGMSRGQIANAALGTSEFTETLEQTANTILVTGYADKPAKHRAITAYRPANDYNQLRELRVESEWELEKILEDGKIPRGDVYESTEGYAVEDYARKFVITRKVIVNDKLGAVMASLDRAGRRVTLMEDRDIFTYINGTPKLSNGANLFSVANKTLATAGAMTGGKDGTLSKGRALLAKQEDLTKQPLGIEDSILLFDSDERSNAEEIILSVSQPNDSRAALWSYLTPVHTPKITGAFYQFADPRDYPVIGFSNLQGEETPYIESKTSFGVRNLEMVIVYTYGYGVIGKVGVVKTAAS